MAPAGRPSVPLPGPGPYRRGVRNLCEDAEGQGGPFLTGQSGTADHPRSGKTASTALYTGCKSASEFWTPAWSATRLLRHGPLVSLACFLTGGGGGRFWDRSRGCGDPPTPKGPRQGSEAGRDPECGLGACALVAGEQAAARWAEITKRGPRGKGGSGKLTRKDSCGVEAAVASSGLGSWLRGGGDRDAARTPDGRCRRKAESPRRVRALQLNWLSQCKRLLPRSASVRHLREPRRPFLPRRTWGAENGPRPGALGRHESLNTDASLLRSSGIPPVTATTGDVPRYEPRSRPSACSIIFQGNVKKNVTEM